MSRLILIPAWRTKDGRVIPLKDMETDHLKNTVAMLRRKGFITTEEATPFPDYPVGFSDMADYYAEQQFDQEVAKYMRQKVSRALGALEKELTSRNAAALEKQLTEASVTSRGNC